MRDGDPPPGSLLISPGTIANDYVGALDLAINGLDSAGQTIAVEEFLDTDDSSTVTAGDVLLRKFDLTDGQVTTIAGQRNLNIPGDEDGAANASILTRFYYPTLEILGRIDGRHIFRVSPSGAGFTPFTASLMVTQADYAGSGISGTVLGGLPPTAQAGALVVVLTAGEDGDLVAVTTTDGGGAFSITTPPGTLSLLVAKAGFVFDAGSSPPIAVSAGSFTTNQTATLATSGRTISGTVRDASTLSGVPAIPVLGESETGFFSFTLSDAAGNYVADATSDPWRMEFEPRATGEHGLMSPKIDEGSAGNVTGFNIDLPRATSLIYGSLRTPSNVPLPFINIEAQTEGSPDYETRGVTDGNGNYTLGVVPASWRVLSEAINHLCEEVVVVVNTEGSAVLENLVAYPITAHLRGEVRDNSNNLVPFLRILASDAANLGGINSYGAADANGAFDLGVFGGGGAMTRAWQLQIAQTDDTQEYVGTSPQFEVQDGVDVEGITYLVYAVTAHLRGQVLDENDAPIGNVGIFAGSGANGEFGSGTDTDGGGNFDIGVFAGTWNLGLSNIDGLGIIPQAFSTTVQDGVDQNGLIFRVRHTTATISGTVTNSSSQPLAGVIVSSTSELGGANYLANSTTDASGNYSLPVFSETWSVGVDSSGLIAQGYSPVGSQDVFVNTGTVTVNFVANPLATAVSRKLHGGTPFDINLPIAGTSGVECRSGGGSNTYQIVVTFGTAVTLANASVTNGTGSVGNTSGSGTSTITIDLAGVVSGQRLTLTLAGVNDGTNTFDFSIPMGVLVGDTTGNGSVTTSDIGQTKAGSGQPVSGLNFRLDVTANGGSINTSDIGLVKSKSGTQLPAP